MEKYFAVECRRVTIAVPSLIIRNAWKPNRLPTSALNAAIFAFSPSTSCCHCSVWRITAGSLMLGPSAARQFPIPEYPACLPCGCCPPFPEGVACPPFSGGACAAPCRAALVAPVLVSCGCWAPLLHDALAPMFASPAVAACTRCAPGPNRPCSGDVFCVIGLKLAPGGGPLELAKASCTVLPGTPSPAQLRPWSPTELRRSVKS